MPEFVTEFNIGQTVRVVPVEMSGVVIAILLDREGMQYKVVFWNESKRHEEWCFGWELKPA